MFFNENFFLILLLLENTNFHCLIPKIFFTFIKSQHTLYGNLSLSAIHMHNMNLLQRVQSHLTLLQAVHSHALSFSSNRLLLLHLQRTTTLETSALEILYSGQVTLSTQLMKPDNLFLTVSGFFLIAFLNVSGLSFMNSNQLRAVKSLLLNFIRISKLKHFHIFQKYVNKINYLSLILLFNYLNPDNHTTFHTPCS